MKHLRISHQTFVNRLKSSTVVISAGPQISAAPLTPWSEKVSLSNKRLPLISAALQEWVHIKDLTIIQP